MRFTSQFGVTGIIRRKIILTVTAECLSHSVSWFCSWVNWEGKNRRVTRRPSRRDQMKSKTAPVVFHSTHNGKPSVTPKNAPPSRFMKMHPGIAKACIAMAQQQQHIRA